MEIIPTILVNTAAEFDTRLKQLSPHFSTIHLDVADGQFVSTTTITGWEELQTLETTTGQAINWGIHLMVKDPGSWLDHFLTLESVRTVVLHIESGGDLKSQCQEIRASGRRVVLAINPGTDVAVLEPFIEHIDAVQFMTVEPGANGAPFVPGAVDRIARFHELHPAMPIWVDGGISPETIKSVARAGATTVCVGSYFARTDEVQYARQILEQSL